jgi:hypothetical protein
MSPLKNLLKKTIKAVLPSGLLGLGRKYYRKIYIPAKLQPLAPSVTTSPQFIVTLTSYGRRVFQKAPYAVYSLFTQSVQPDRIVLWLAAGTKVPNKLQKMKALGLEIRFCKDIRSYKKLIPALAAFPEDILISADDDVYYHFDWFKKLKASYIKNPQKIHCHRAHEICLDEHKQVIPYSEWRCCVKNIEYAKRLFPTGVGGVLYPPRAFNHEVLQEEVFLHLAPTADDVWFWAMAHHNGTEFTLVKDGLPEVAGIGANDDGLWKTNVAFGKNDEQIHNVLQAYPDVYKTIL